MWGRDENFYEWSAGDLSLPSLAITWQPTQQLRFNGTYTAEVDHRHTDGSIVEAQYLPRLDAEYQLSRVIFFRIIGQYNAVYQDSLRDDSRSNLPIAIRDPATR